jgi:hydrogenase maturation factor
VAIMAQRESLGFETSIGPTPRRCTAWSPRWREAVPDIHALRDPTRGGSPPR